MEQIEPQQGVHRPSQAEAVLEGDAHQARHHVIKPDQLRGTVQTFHAKENFGGVFIVMDADVKSPLPGDLDLLRDVLTASGESTTLVRCVSYIGHACCNSL